MGCNTLLLPNGGRVPSSGPALSPEAAAPYTPRLIQGVRVTVILAVGGSPQTRIAAAADCRLAAAILKRDKRSGARGGGLDMGARLRLG